MELWQKMVGLSAILGFFVALAVWLKIEVPEYLVPTAVLTAILAYLVIYFDHKLSEKQDKRKTVAKKGDKSA